MAYRRQTAWFFLIFSLFSHEAVAETIRVAVASNFLKPMKQLAQGFKEHSGHELLLSSASTGKLYAQIRQGAPFDVFFSADSAKVDQLITEGRAVAQSSWIYAQGQLVLWAKAEMSPDELEQKLRSASLKKLAIAHPLHAPYGQAAQQALEAMKLWQALKNQLVFGENINQAFLFVESGNAEMGLVALSSLPVQKNFWKIPQHYYRPVLQKAVLLNESPAARQLKDFFQLAATQKTIEEQGYAFSR